MKHQNVFQPTPQLAFSKVYSELFKHAPSAVVFSILMSSISHLYIKHHNNLNTISLHQYFDLYSEHTKSLSDADLKELCTKTSDEMQVTEDEANFLEKATGRQSQHMAWHEHHKGCVTASHFTMCTTT